ncbi:amino acid permease [Herbihabitans rhizosphaerae]|nr:amino acid permease [Herbihabitans rhizosphaerae]
MIAIGGAIGVGLFLGAGGRLHAMGPSLLLVYAVCGLAGWMVMRAIAELVLYKPVAGSFVEYSREFIGPWAGFAAGWMYWFNWAATCVVEITAAAIYVGRWAPDMPQWLTALICLVVLLAVNLLSVKLFGELEFWFAIIKVTAIVVFLVVGTGLVLTAADMGGGVHASPSHATSHDGLFPHGIGIALISMQAVIFAYNGIEMVAITVGETRNPREVLPKAARAVAWRIGFFYVGSVLLLVMLLPWHMYTGDESPFVTVFSRLGIPAAGDVMNLVVLTAALSSCNSGIYATGRTLRSLAHRGDAPSFTARLSSRKVPIGGIAVTAVVMLVGVGLNYVVPKQAFDLAIAVASIGVLASWASLIYSQIRLHAKAKRGELERPKFRVPGSPYTGYATLAFLLLVLVLMAFSSGVERYAFYLVPVVALTLAVGWWVLSRRRRSDVLGDQAR